MSFLGLSDATWLLLDRFGILLGDIVMLSTLIAASVGFVQRKHLRRWLRRNSFPDQISTTEHCRWQALIFTLSRHEVPEWAIQQVQPLSIGVLITQNAMSQRAHAQLVNYCQPRGIHVFTEHLNDPDNPFESKRKIQTLIQTIEAQHFHPLAIDITGGKTTMSLGAFMAAEEAGVVCIYITTDFKDHQPDLRTARIKTLTEANQ